MSERAYQAKMTTDIYSRWGDGARNVLAVLPTGGGKSHIVSGIVQNEHRAGAVQCVVAHRVELVSQMSMHIANRGIAHRIIAPNKVRSAIDAAHRKAFRGRSLIDPHSTCSVVGVDTLISRVDDPEIAKWCAQVTRWTVDEAHHVLRQNKWGKAVALFPNAYGLGVTATPQRADGAGLGSHADGVFDTMVLGPSMRELIAAKFLSDYEIVCPKSDLVVTDDDISAGGDYSPKKLAEASKNSQIVGDTVENYKKYALHKRTIAFVTDVETAGKVAANFKAQGIAAEAISALTPSNVRDELVNRFRDGRVQILVNVDLFGEGFDCPACECVIMARPTASLAVYLQQFGRALRIMDGKLFGLIIDMVSNFRRHGFPDRAHLWTLDRRDKRAKRMPDPEDIPLTSCVECSRPYVQALPVCPHCGHEPIVEPRSRGSVEQVEGDLTLLDRDALAALRAAIELPSAGDVAQRAMYAAGPAAAAGAGNRQVERIQAQTQLRETIALWAGHQRALGRSDRESYKRFYLTLGIDVLSSLTLPRGDMEKLNQQIGEWIK